MSDSSLWDRLSARAGRNDMPDILLDAYEFGAFSGDADALAHAMERAWTMAEWPTRLVDPENWLEMFHDASASGHYNLDGELVERTELPETITLWRGCHMDYKVNLSWTGDREQAEWFAHRFDGVWDGRLYTLEAPREVILAHFTTSRREDEYVIDIHTIEDRIEEVS